MEENEEQKAEIITNFISKQIKLPMNQVDDVLVDYVLKCISGPYQGKFLYINLTQDGETFGSDPDGDLTMYIARGGLSKKHCKIQYYSQTRRYHLFDTESETGVWIKCRCEAPMIVQDELVFRIFDKQLKLMYIKEEFDILEEWLKRIDLLKLKDYFISQNIKTLNNIRNLKKEDLDNMDLDEVQQQNLQIAISELDEDFPDTQFSLHKLRLLDYLTNEILIEKIGWSGATIGTTPDCDYQFYSKNKGNQHLALIVKYQYGDYWLIPSTSAQNQIFSKLNQNYSHILTPDDIFNIGELNFLVERYNMGHCEDQGTRPNFEDETTVIQELHISERLSASLFGIYDGHGGRDCAKFVAMEIPEKIRNEVVQDGQFEQRDDWYRYWYEKLSRIFYEVDCAFYFEHSDLAKSCGCTANIVLIIGNKIICANLGDGRAVLSRKGKAIDLSVDQKPENPNETLRIKQAGGNVMMNRIDGTLGVARAFGDFLYKPKSMSLYENTKSVKGDLVSNLCEIRVIDIDYLTDEFVIIACDGLFDSFTSQDAIDFCRNQLSEMPLMEQDASIVTKNLVAEAVKKSKEKRNGKSDNVSALLICLNRGIDPKPVVDQKPGMHKKTLL